MSRAGACALVVLSIACRGRSTPEVATGSGSAAAVPGPATRLEWPAADEAFLVAIAATDGFQLDAAGTERPLASAATLGAEPTEIDVSADGRRVLVRAGAKLLAIAAGAPPRELAAGDGARDPRLSPDGTRVAFVRDGDLWTM